MEEENITKELIKGVFYDPNIKYQIISKTGALVRKEEYLSSKVFGDKIKKGEIVSIKQRKYLSDYKIMRIQIATTASAANADANANADADAAANADADADAVAAAATKADAGWITESKKIVALCEGEKEPVFFQGLSTCERDDQNWSENCKFDIACLDENKKYNVKEMQNQVLNLLKNKGIEFIPKQYIMGKTSYNLYKNTKGWSSLALRTIGGIEGEEGNRHSGEADEKTIYEYTSLITSCSYIKSIIDDFAKENNVYIEKVRLMKLSSGGVIGNYLFIPTFSFFFLFYFFFISKKKKLLIKISFHF